MKALLTTTAAVALLLAPAFAQDEPLEQPAEPLEEIEPAPEDELGQAEEEATEEEDVQQAEEEATDEADAMAVAEVTFIDQQADDQRLASEWIGQTVYNDNDEGLGEINDLLFAEDGSLHGVVLGVGGFLGIGQKAVAFNFDAIESRVDPESGETTLYLSVTSEQLDSAPSFMTLADIRAQEEIERLESMQPAEPGLAPEAPQ